jgi:hypothetical protein
VRPVMIVPPPIVFHQRLGLPKVAKDFGSYGFSGGTPVAVPLPGALLLFVSGMGSALAFGRRFFSVS